jgi:ParB/RepB/Spo0J family partition protein
VTATLSIVPLAKIKPRPGFNPRSDFADEQMAELIESVRRHGIITPLTLEPDADGRFTIIAGERRYRAAKAAKLREVPAQVREADGEALTLAVAENVIRADLNPVEEARAYQRLTEEQGDAAKVAALVGKSERLIAERLDLDSSVLAPGHKVFDACACGRGRGRIVGRRWEPCAISYRRLDVLRLLGNVDPVLVAGVALDVAERCFCVVVGSKLFELLLHPATPFERELEVLTQLAPGPAAIGMEDLQQTRDGPPNRLLVTRG